MTSIGPDSASQSDQITTWTWWTLAELHSNDEKIHSREITELLTTYLIAGAIEDPIASQRERGVGAARTGVPPMTDAGGRRQVSPR